MPAKKCVVIGFLGTQLDSGWAADRWDRWRPTVALCQDEHLLVDRLELLCQPKFENVRDQICADLAGCSPETTVRCHDVPLRDPWDFAGVYGTLHDFARAYPFDTEREDYLIHITTGSHVAQICLFLLTETHHFPAKLIQTSPPNRHGPARHAIIDLDLSKYDRLAARFDVEQRQSADFLKGGIATRNARFNALIDEIERVAIASRAPILLAGPTGAGKSQLARRIYELKKHRRQTAGAFVEVNCATLRGDTAASALFGHAKGAFTGAVAARPGLLRAADGGVLFLDEIGELGADEQAMLLRAIEEKRFLAVGSDEETSSDFQLIAGTNRDLPAAVRAGRFRDDLLARINLWTYALPPLRERTEDVEPNLDFELERFARVHGSRVVMNREARERFLAFAVAPEARWCGNFRDLNAAVTRMATLAAGGRITPAHVDAEIARLADAWRAIDGDDVSKTATPADDALDELLAPEAQEAIDPFDRVQLAEVVGVCRASRTLSDAGRKLFSASRRAKQNPNDADRLRKYLARFGLDWARVTGSD